MANVFQQSHCSICSGDVNDDDWLVSTEEYDGEVYPVFLFHRSCYEKEFGKIDPIFKSEHEWGF